MIEKKKKKTNSPGGFHQEEAKSKENLRIRGFEK